MGKKIESVPAEAFETLDRYHWPGNVRELENLIERTMVMTDGDTLELADFGNPSAADARAAANGLSIKRGTRDLEIGLIQRALEETGGNRTRAAQLL
jgi:DNA-binding NtrC family response regulator